MVSPGILENMLSEEYNDRYFIDYLALDKPNQPYRTVERSQESTADETTTDGLLSNE